MTRTSRTPRWTSCVRQLLGRLGDDRAAILSFVRWAGSTFRRLEDSPLPVIAAVNGAAVAGGFELVLACDVVLAAEGALLGDGHLRYGVLPGGGSAVRLERKVPANIGRRLLLTGDLEPADRFRGWGLIEEVVPAAELLDRAQRSRVMSTPSTSAKTSVPSGTGEHRGSKAVERSRSVASEDRPFLSTSRLRSRRSDLGHAGADLATTAVLLLLVLVALGLPLLSGGRGSLARSIGPTSR
jgi:hypothetical protein